MSGDVGTGSEQDCPTSFIERYYNETGGKVAATIVKVIRHRIGKRINDTSSTGELGERNADLFERLTNTLLPYWEKQASIEAAQENAENVAGLIVGGLSLGLDATDDEG
jgi:hypothetical protein